VFVFRRVRSSRFVEEWGELLNVVLDVSGHGLGLELQVP